MIELLDMTNWPQWGQAIGLVAFCLIVFKLLTVPLWGPVMEQ